MLTTEDEASTAKRTNAGRGDSGIAMQFPKYTFNVYKIQLILVY